MTFVLVVNHFENPDIFVHSPENAGDWINLVQMSVVLVLWLILSVASYLFTSLPTHAEAFAELV
jgi:hypothetical protein